MAPNNLRSELGRMGRLGNAIAAHPPGALMHITRYRLDCRGFLALPALCRRLGSAWEAWRDRDVRFDTAGHSPFAS
jgi:hypothetical protein